MGHHHRAGTVLVSAIAALLLAVVPARGQGPTSGSINGTVTDNTGAVLPGVTVTATSPALLGSQTGVTNEQGAYRFPSVPPGVYKLTYELTGFSTVVRESIQVPLGFTATINVQLAVGTLQESVTVSGESPVVDTQNTTVQNNFNSEMLKAIPNARDIWSLMAEAPGMTVSRFDVGGSTAGTQTGFTAYGSGGQNRVQVDGANTTEGTDAAGFYFDYGAFEEISFGASNASDAQMPTPGVMINTVLKSGGNEIHGDVYADYENESLQGDNTKSLKALGVGEGTRIKKYFDPNVNLGGPIKRDKLWYFTSIRHQEIATSITGWPFDGDPTQSPDFLTRLQNITYKLTYQLNQNNKITHFLQWGRKFQPYRDAAATRTVDGVYSQNSFSYAGKVEWNHIVSPTLFFDVRASGFGYNWPNQPYAPDGTVATSKDQLNYRRSDQITGNFAGGFSGYRYDRRRWQFETVGNWYRDGLLGANHSVKFGWTGEHEAIEDEEYGGRDSIELIFRSTSGVDFASPFRVQLESDPTTFTDALWHHGLFVQDQIQAGPRVTINAGARWDYYNAYQPEQVVRESPWREFFWGGQPLQTPNGPYSIPAASFAGTWNVPARKGIIVLKDIAPRLGVSWDVQGNGRTVVKVNYGRFYFNPGVSYTDDTNPLQETTATFGWNDRNGDKLFQINELGNFVSLAGGARNSMAPGIKNAHTDEANLFFERQLIPDLGLRVGYVWKKQNDRWALVDTTRPYDLWSVPRTVVDPGPDGRTGTGDDGSITAYDLAQVTTSVSQWQARDDYDQTYKNVDVTINKRMSHRWSLVASYLFTWRNESYLGGNRGVPQNPNEALNNFTDDTLWTFKLFGTYQAPWGINISPVLRHQAGDPLPRRVSVSTNGGTFNVLVEPSGSYRETNVTIFDTRVEKLFRFGGARRLGLFFDAYNINNSHAFQAQESITGLRTITVDGVSSQVPRFLYPTVVISPRIFKFGVRYSF
ncbi:MAG TPA: carboxypeptidase regulatory-like domain-containing protein [Vicinamibacterales bacterium]|nr:carboxypeptidase regulatory-like domain-containing protein [Vicinamibacterales bacterium]